MQRKLTITLEDEVYQGLHQLVGPQQISRFIEALLRPHVLTVSLDAGYRDLAADEAQEKEALLPRATCEDFSVLREMWSRAEQSESLARQIRSKYQLGDAD